ncbi:MAG: hypothetical protein ABIN20_02110 [candidate division WOR-3 bacterium]
MKKILILSGLFIAIIYFAACGGDEEIATPNARITQILNQGEGLRFEWDPVDGADGYRVYVDGTQQYQGTNTYFEWTNPAKIIEIVAYAGDKESTPKRFDFTPVITSNLVVYDATDPDTNHPSYVVFTNGTASAVNASQKGEAWMFFIADSLSSNYHNNSNVDAAFAEISGTFDAANLAPTEGNYLTRQPAVAGSAYYIWFEFSPIDGNIGANDYFAKIKINSISGTQYNVTIAFQKYPGLRWLKTQ